MSLVDRYGAGVLGALQGPGGMSTADIARNVGTRYGGSNRSHIAAIRRVLDELERRRLVTRFDDERPIAWCLA